MFPTEIECPDCGGHGCENCNQGLWRLVGCPKKYIDGSLTQAINFASFAIEGHWPLSGGLLEQSAWFIDLVAMLKSEQSLIDSERAKKLYG